MACNECTQTCVHEKIAAWAGVPVANITSQTQLNGLGSKTWPADGEPLIQELSILCNRAIPAATWQAWVIVADIDDYLGVGEEEDK